MLKIGIVGTGYFGEKHIKVLLELNNLFNLIGFFDVNKTRSKEISKKYNLKKLPLNKLIEKSDVINIVSETKSHFELIKLILNKKKHVFVEKPICETVSQIREIKKLQEISQTYVQIGFIERFNPAFLSTSSIKFIPKYIKSVRLTPLLKRNQKNSIIQDLMIHDIDIINEIINSSPKNISIQERTKNKISCKIDYNNNCIAELYAERIKSKNKMLERKMTIKTKKNEKIIIDFLKQETIIEKGQKTVFLKTKKNNQLADELIYLHDCITEKKQNKISIQEGIKCGVISEEIEKKYHEL